MAKRLTGLNPLSYIGVEPYSPPELVTDDRSPTPNDSSNFNLGTLWLVRDPSAPGDEEIWMLVSLAGNIATWVQLYPSGNNNFMFTTQGGTATFMANNLNVFGGTNITTTAIFGPGDTITINLNDNVELAGTLTVDSLGAGVVFSDAAGLLSSSNGTNGQVIIGGGTDPIWASLTSSDNSITITVGPNSIDLKAVGSGGGASTFHTDGGDATTAGGAITIAGANVIETDGAGSTVTVRATQGLDGQLIIGATGLDPAWASLTSTGGTVAISVGPNTINLEAAGVGSGAITFHTDGADATVAGAAITIAGGVNITTSGAGSTVTIDLDDNVTLSPAGSLTIESLGAGVVQTDAGGGFFSDNGTNGQILIGGGAAPVWANITAGTNITITNNPNSITINSTGGGGGGGGTTDFITNSGTAVQSGGQINIYGDGVFPLGNVQTQADLVTTPDSVIVFLNDSLRLPMSNGSTGAGSTGQFWIGGQRYFHMYGQNAATSNTWIGRNAGSLTLTTATALNNVGVGASALNALTTGAGNSAVGNRSLTALTTGDNNTGVGYETLKALTTGSNNVAIGTSALVVATTAARNIAIGRSSMATSTTSSANVAVGDQAMQGNTTGTQNVAVGKDALTAGTIASTNVALGNQALSTLTTGSNNVAVGSGSLSAAAGSAGNNIAIGLNAGSSLVAGSNNIYLANLGASESNTIRIGIATHSAAYMNGIYNSSIGATYGLVAIDSNHKLGTALGGTNGQVPIAATGGNVKLATITSSDDSITITGGANTLDLTVKNIAFQAYLGTDVADVTGDGTLYMYGSTQAFTQDYNIGGGTLTLGGAGTNLSFRAPVTGVYRFQVNCLLGDLVAPATVAPNPVCPLMLMVRNNPATTPNVRTYALIGSFWWPQTSDPDFPEVMNYFWTADIALTAAQYVVCGISLTYGAGTKTLDLVASTNIPIFYGNIRGTFFSGSLLART